MFKQFSKSSVLPSTILVASSLLLSGCGWYNKGKEAVMTPVRNLVPGGELTEVLTLSADAKSDYDGAYKNDPFNKAFAASPSGAYGVAFGATDVKQAKQAALKKCTEDLVPGALECIIYDANGTIVFTPTKLKRVK